MKHFLFLLFALPLVLVSCNPDEDDSELSGCMDPDAVNFSANATVDDGSCVYDESSGCGGASTVTYDGYTYDLVAIGDQCWFAENLRNDHYANGDAIAGGVEYDWENAGLTNSGAQAIYEYNSFHLEAYGRLYNWYAVVDARGLCPSGWHVPTDGEFMTLEMELGMSESEANSGDHRGTDQGTQMKSSPEDSPTWNGTNTSGFSGLAGGSRDYEGDFGSGGYIGFFWSASANFTNEEPEAWCRKLLTNGWEENPAAGDQVTRYSGDQREGKSIRCVRD